MIDMVDRSQAVDHWRTQPKDHQSRWAPSSNKNVPGPPRWQAEGGDMCVVDSIWRSTGVHHTGQGQF